MIIALTTFDTDHNILRAQRQGATGFLLKSTPPEDLIGLVRIAARTHLTEGTIKNYVSQILTKLHCTNRTQAGLLAQQAGLRDS